MCLQYLERFWLASLISLKPFCKIDKYGKDKITMK